MVIRFIREIQLLTYAYQNFFNKCVERHLAGRLIPKRKSVFQIHNNSKLILKGVLTTNANCLFNSSRDTLIRIDNGAAMQVDGDFSVFYGGDIVIFENGKLEIGSGFCNSNIKIRCKKHITIGHNVAISHNVTIMDSDAHVLLRDEYDMTQPIVIGDNVWVGSGAIILKGVCIGNGAIIAAGSVVTKDVPGNSLVAGVPARVMRHNVSWISG